MVDAREIRTAPGKDTKFRKASSIVVLRQALKRVCLSTPVLTGAARAGAVALTAFAMKRDEERAPEAGCDAYVSKPIDTRSLPARIAALLESLPRTRD